MINKYRLVGLLHTSGRSSIDSLFTAKIHKNFMLRESSLIRFEIWFFSVVQRCMGFQGRVTSSNPLQRPKNLRRNIELVIIWNLRRQTVKSWTSCNYPFFSLHNTSIYWRNYFRNLWLKSSTQIKIKTQKTQFECKTIFWHLIKIMR